MINIVENNSIKSPGKTSLKLTFDYNERVILKLKEVGGGVWIPKEKFWEFPLSKLSDLIDNLTTFDDIKLSFIEEKSDWIHQTIKHEVKPFKHQDEGIEWMINHESGILGDVPGLGKTLTTIYSAEELKKQKGIEHCLIVCGINTLKQNWKKEIQKCSTESCRVIGEKIGKSGKVKYATIKERAEELYNPIDEFFVILNIESLRNDLVIEAIKNSKNKFDMIVLDECHKCLTGETLIQTDRGLYPIKDLVESNIDCKVLSFNAETKKYEYKKILNRYKLNTFSTIKLTIEDNMNLINIECTPTHRFYTKNRGWVMAKDLTDEDDLILKK